MLATHEAAANAIERAAAPSPIQIRARVAASTIAVEIKDDGRWRTEDAKSEEGGLGLRLIENLVSAMTIETSENGTTLRLLQRL